MAQNEANLSDHPPPNLSDLDEDEQHREVYARAALAFYFAQVFEQGLVHAVYAGQLVDGSLVKDFKSADDFHDLIDKKTAGAVVSLLRRHLELEPELDALLAEALRNRNFLIHRFFVERAELFFYEEGRQLMIEELHQTTQVFRRADKHLETVFFEQGGKFGLTRELVSYLFTALKNEARPGGRPTFEIVEEVMRQAGRKSRPASDQ
jgi:hypothetical protein